MATNTQGREMQHCELALRLRLDFLFDELECSRILLVPAASPLDDLHTMIQACGNWLNYHLYNFKFVSKGRLVQAEPLWQIEQLEDFTPEIAKRDAAKVSVEDALSELPSMLYSYDYGDGWEISITRMGYLFDRESSALPRVEKGIGAWPPDDVGGEGGLSRFLHVWDDPADPEHDYFADWGKQRGFEKCSLAKCNRRLSRWEDFRAKEA